MKLGTNPPSAFSFLFDSGLFLISVKILSAFSTSASLCLITFSASSLLLIFKRGIISSLSCSDRCLPSKAISIDFSEAITSFSLEIPKFLNIKSVSSGVYPDFGSLKSSAEVALILLRTFCKKLLCPCVI